MKSNNLSHLFIRHILCLGALFVCSKPSFALSKITDAPMASDRLYQSTPNGFVVFVDHTGRLFSAKNDGTELKNISAQKPNETDSERLVVVAKQPSEFIVVSSSTNSQDVYFQARENSHSFKLFLYKSSLTGAAAPQKLFQLIKPIKQFKLSPDGSELYISGDDKHSILTLATAQKRDLPLIAVPAASYRVSNDFKWVAFVSEFRFQNQRNFELHVLNIENGDTRTLLQGLLQYDFKFEFSHDSSSISAQEITQAGQRLVNLSLEGDSVIQVFPLPGETINYKIEDISPIPGIRGEGDTGAVVFSARDERQVKKIFMADMIDLAPRTLDTREGQGESVMQMRLSPDFKTIVFQRGPIFEDPMVTRPRTYSLNILEANSRPVFLFENEYQHSEFLSDGSALVFVSAGGYYARNQIVEVSLDGVSSRVLSTNFPENWLSDKEQISRLGVGPAKTFYISTINVQQSPARYTLQSFQSN